MRTALSLVAFFLGISFAHAQLVINEACNANQNNFVDEYGETPDWIELYNSGSSPIDLSGFCLSDNSNSPTKFRLPAVILNPGQFIIVLASGRNIPEVVNHWETAIFATDTFNYIVPAVEPDTNWIYPGFVPAGWNIGRGPIGYGDGDDSTVTANCNSVYFFKTFTISDTAAIAKAVLSMDYDDGFVAYLNGKEIARNNLGTAGIRPAFNENTPGLVEATMYTGGTPTDFPVDQNVLHQNMIQGTNVLAVQVHNNSIASSDLSSLTFLSLGIENSSIFYNPTPLWFSQNSGFIHANFKIASGGETLFLADTLGNIVNQLILPFLDLNHSIGRTPDGNSNVCYFNVPTPNASNNGSNCFSGYIDNPIIGLPAGHYTNPTSTNITSLSGTGIIKYTTDGDEPEITDSTFTTPIPLGATTVIRARIFPLSGTLLPSRIATSSYLFNENTTMSVFSLVTDSLNLWDYNYGIYVYGPNSDSLNYPFFGSNFWENWERPIHIEYFAKDYQLKFSYNGGVKIHGGWSRGNSQKSLRILSDSKYGPGNMSYPIIDDKPFISAFTNINLRNGGNDYWDARSRDAFMQRLVKNTHVDYMSYEPCNVWLNGMYWGEYEIREREDEFYIENNHGVAADNVDIVALTYAGFNEIAGSGQGYYDMLNFAVSNTPTDTAFFYAMQPYLDIENFCDYFITESYVGNGDFMSGYPNNIKMWKPADQIGPWRHVLWDIDFGLGLYDGNTSRNYLNEIRTSGIAPGALLDYMLQNPIFRNYFINRYADLINTVFQTQHLQETAGPMLDSLLGDLPRHQAQWGGNMPNTYQTYINMINYNVGRIPDQRNNIQTDFALTSQVDVTLETFPAGAGLIKISTIIPETLPWTGVYYNGNPVRITAIPNPGYTFLHWNANNVMPQDTNESVYLNIFLSDTFTAVFAGSPASAEIVISEINYNCDSSANSGNWFEIWNRDTSTVDLTGWYAEKTTPYLRFYFPDRTILQPDERLVICSDSLKFRNQFPFMNNCVKNQHFDLGNSGDRIALYNARNELQCEVNFTDIAPWQPATDGTGRTMELVETANNINLPQSWFTGCMYGSPGTQYVPCFDYITISEINYNPLANMGDWIELWNTTFLPVDLSGWTFKDDNDANAYVIPAGTILNSNERIVICQDTALFSSVWNLITNRVGNFSFQLANSGELIRLYDNTGKIRFSMIYDDNNPWPVDADGNGKTLEQYDFSANCNSASNWFAGCPNGSPGRYYDPNCFVSVEEFAKAGFKTWYDPSQGMINVSFENTEGFVGVELYDISGKKLENSRSNSNLIRFDATELANGIYQIKVIFTSGTATEKIAVVK